MSLRSDRPCSCVLAHYLEVGDSRLPGPAFKENDLKRWPRLWTYISPAYLGIRVGDIFPEIVADEPLEPSATRPMDVKDLHVDPTQDTSLGTHGRFDQSALESPTFAYKRVRQAPSS